MFCSNCGKEIQQGAIFCSNCGANVGGVSTVPNAPITNPSVENQKPDVPKVNLADTLNKVKDNEFVKSVKQDVGNSQSINMIKNKVGTSVEKAKKGGFAKKINKKLVIAIVAVVAVLVVVFNLHTCEECEEIYFGEKNVINFWGEYSEVCDECYRDFYSW